MSLTAAQASEFTAYARSPETWAVAARRQLAVALHLIAHGDELSRRPQHSFEERSGSHYSAYLHLGYAIENAAKAALVAADPSVINPQGTVNRSSLGGNSGHGLVSLATDALGVLAQPERDLLEKLQEYVLWAGRYTIPLRADVLFDEQRMNRLRSGSTEEGEQVTKLVSRLLNCAGLPR